MLKIKQKKIPVYIAVVALLVFFHMFGWLRPVENVFARILTPFFSSLYSFGTNIKQAYEKQTDKRDLNKINSELTETVNRLSVENAKLKTLEEENGTLREYLKFLAKNEYKYMLGNVISRGDFTGSGESIIIDKGAKDGVSKGLAVVSSFGVIIGKVMDVKDNVSEVYLSTNPKCKLAAAIQNSNRTSGIAQGELGLTIKMDFIPQTDKLNAGDNVVTSGLEPNIPRGIIIGKIDKVFQENKDLWQSASLEPLIGQKDLVIVSVLLPAVKEKK